MTNISALTLFATTCFCAPSAKALPFDKVKGHTIELIRHVHNREDLQCTTAGFCEVDSMINLDSAVFRAVCGNQYLLPADKPAKARAAIRAELMRELSMIFL